MAQGAEGILVTTAPVNKRDAPKGQKALFFGGPTPSLLTRQKKWGREKAFFKDGVLETGSRALVGRKSLTKEKERMVRLWPPHIIIYIWMPGRNCAKLEWRRPSWRHGSCCATHRKRRGTNSYRDMKSLCVRPCGAPLSGAHGPTSGGRTGGLHHRGVGVLRPDTGYLPGMVLIPRVDTETLVDRGIVFVKDLPGTAPGCWTCAPAAAVWAWPWRPTAPECPGRAG